MEELGFEFRPDLIRKLPDARTDGGDDTPLVGTDRLHRRNRRLDDAGLRAPPTGMSRGNHLSLCVSEENRRAVGRKAPTARPGVLVTTASALGSSLGSTGSSMTSAVGVWA